MTETLAERHYLDRMQSVRKLASLPEPERAAMSWPDYQDLIGLCVELATSGQALFEAEYRRIFKDKNLTIAWLSDRRRVIEELSDNFARLAESVKAVAAQAWEKAGRPAGEDFAAKLDEAVRAMSEAKRSVLERWLIGSPEEMAASDAAIARGDTLDIDEVFAEIAGLDVPGWQQRISDHLQNTK